MHTMIGIIFAVVLLISGFAIIGTSVKELQDSNPVVYIVPVGGGLLLSAIGTISLIQYCLM